MKAYIHLLEQVFYQYIAQSTKINNHPKHLHCNHWKLNVSSEDCGPPAYQVISLLFFWEGAKEWSGIGGSLEPQDPQFPKDRHVFVDNGRPKSEARSQNGVIPEMPGIPAFRKRKDFTGAPNSWYFQSEPSGTWILRGKESYLTASFLALGKGRCHESNVSHFREGFVQVFNRISY